MYTSTQRFGKESKSYQPRQANNVRKKKIITIIAIKVQFSIYMYRNEAL